MEAGGSVLRLQAMGHSSAPRAPAVGVGKQVIQGIVCCDTHPVTPGLGDAIAWIYDRSRDKRACSEPEPSLRQPGSRVHRQDAHLLKLCRLYIECDIMMAGAAPGHLVLEGVNLDWVIARHRAADDDVHGQRLAPDVLSHPGGRRLTEAGIA